MDFGTVIKNATPLLLEGLKYTALVSILAIIFGIILGLLLCIMKMSKVGVLRFISGAYIWIIRGTPMLVQAFLIFFGFPQLFNLINGAINGMVGFEMMSTSFRFDALTAGIITLSLNASAYMAEIFRGGILAIPKGQEEAARSLGLSKSKTYFKVILPQAFKISIPSLVNQFIISIKDTSILSCIGLAEIVNKAKTYVGSTYQFFATYILVAVFYLIIISLLMILTNYLEKRLKYEQKRHRDSH